MKNIIRKFTLLGGLVLDCSACKFSVGKVYILLMQNRRIVGCELDLECVASSLPHLSLIFSFKISKKETDLTWNDYVQQNAFKLVKVVEELDLKHRTNVWEMPAGFPIMQIFPLGKLCRLSIYHWKCFHYD